MDTLRDLRLELLTPALTASTTWWTDDPEHTRYCEELDPEREAEVREKVLNEPGTVNRCFWIGCMGDEPVAMALAEISDDGTAWIALSVRPERRRQGVGAAVVRLLRSRPELAGLRLFASVHPENVASGSLMRRLGGIERNSGDDGLLRIELPTTSGRSATGVTRWGRHSNNDHPAKP